MTDLTKKAHPVIGLGEMLLFPLPESTFRPNSWAYELVNNYNIEQLASLLGFKCET